MAELFLGHSQTPGFLEIIKTTGLEETACFTILASLTKLKIFLNSALVDVAPETVCGQKVSLFLWTEELERRYMWEHQIERVWDLAGNGKT